MFQGHTISGLILDFQLALTSPIYVYWLGKVVESVKSKQSSRSGEPKRSILILAAGFFYVLLTPNATYAFLELKHLVIKDVIAQPINIWSVIVFGGLSLTGLIASMVCILATVKILRPTKKYQPASIIAVSLIQASGATLGELDVFSWDVILNPLKVLRGIETVMGSPNLMLFIAVLTGFLTLMSLLVIWSTKKAIK